MDRRGHRSVEVALALVERAGRWLVTRRGEGRVFAGLWEFPGGKMASGEDAPTAAVRETREETGLGVEPVGDLGSIRTRHEGSEVILRLVRCQVARGEPSLASRDIVDLRWVTLEELRSLPMPPANAEILDRLESLRS